MGSIKLLDIIYPKLNICVCCLSKIPKAYLCNECSFGISFNKSYEGKKFDDFDFYYACYYMGTIKEIIYNFKVNKNFLAGEFLSDIIFEYIKKCNIDFDFISYIPRDENKIKKEGFDQSEFLSKIVAKKCNKKHIKIFKCLGKKVDQKKIGLEDRIRNVKGKFEVLNFKKVDGSKILIIDDVATTHSTSKECAAIFKDINKDSQLSLLTIAKSLI